MRTAFTLLAALFAFLIAAAPAAAHHGRGSHERGPDSDQRPRIVKWQGRGGFSLCDWRSNPGSCPGNSGWAHLCKENNPTGWARGLCLSERARYWGLNLDDDDNDDGRHGELAITDIDVDEDGWFRVQGRGAEGAVTLSVSGVSGQVVGFGQGDANGEGRFEIVGLWACRDDDDEHDARVRAQDADERDSQRVTFPCDDED